MEFEKLLRIKLYILFLFLTPSLNYVSCSPFRIPVARLAAVQAVIELLTLF